MGSRGLPIILHASAVAPVLVVAAALWSGRGFRFHGWVLAGCLISLASDGLALSLGARSVNNHWVTYLTGPAMYASFLMAMVPRQETYLAGRAVRAIVVLFLVASVGLAGLVEQVGNFSQYVWPLGSLLLLMVSLWTLLTMGLRAGAGATQRLPLLWLPIGLALYSGVAVAYFPLAASFSSSRPDLVVAATKLKAGIVALAFGIIAWGVVWRTEQRPSGSSMSASS